LILGASNTTWGSVSLPYSFAWLGMPTCELHVSWDLSVPLIVQGSTAIGLLRVPAVASILGQSLYLQALVSDPGVQRGRPHDVERGAGDVRRHVEVGEQHTAKTVGSHREPVGRGLREDARSVVDPEQRPPAGSQLGTHGVDVAIAVEVHEVHPTGPVAKTCPAVNRVKGPL